MDQLPRLGKRELSCLLLFTCNYVVFVWRGCLFLCVLGMGYVILLWHSLSLPYNYIALTDGSCHPNPGPCGAGACVYLPYETTHVSLKQPVSKRGSILLGEMIAIKMVFDFMLEKLHQKVKFMKVLILSDSQSSVGLLTLGWEPTQHKSTSKDILTELELVNQKKRDRS